MPPANGSLVLPHSLWEYITGYHFLKELDDLLLPGGILTAHVNTTTCTASNELTRDSPAVFLTCLLCLIFAIRIAALDKNTHSYLSIITPVITSPCFYMERDPWLQMSKSNFQKLLKVKVIWHKCNNNPTLVL